MFMLLQTFVTFLYKGVLMFVEIRYMIKFYTIIGILLLFSVICSHRHVVAKVVALMPGSQHVEKIGCDVGFVNKYKTRKGCVLA
jgi:hypothetical protein